MGRQFDDTKVAIVIAVYNDRDNIERAIRSAAAQILPDKYTLDVLIVDDCSTDESFQIAQTVCAELPNARAFELDQNGGPSQARNEALRHTDAAWFMPLDSDDALDPGRLAKLLDVARSEGVDMVADNLFITYADQPFEIVRPLWANKPAGFLPLTAEFFVQRSFDVEAERSELGYLKPLISRKILQKPEAPYQPQLRFAEDYELYTRLLLDGAKAVLTEGFGYYFIQRERSSSRSHGGAEHRKIVDIDRAFLDRRDLSEGERRAIKGHLNYSKKEWAHWTLIEAGRERDPKKFLSGLFMSWSSIPFLWRAVVRRLVSFGGRARS